jgi:hypothetical protein
LIEELENEMAARKVDIEFVKTYATEANAMKAAEKACEGAKDDLRYYVVRNADDRFGVLFIGEVAVQNMLHFKGFNIIG